VLLEWPHAIKYGNINRLARGLGNHLGYSADVACGQALGTISRRNCTNGYPNGYAARYFKKGREYFADYEYFKA
jgi:hypothetical protein